MTGRDGRPEPIGGAASLRAVSLADDEELLPSRRWQQLVKEDLGRLDGPADTAERLLLHLHYAIDWDRSWVKDYLSDYWDRHLPERVLLAAYQSTTLDGWWSFACNQLGAGAPRYDDRRREVAMLLRDPAGAKVIDVFHTDLLALVMRTQIIRDAVDRQRKGAR